VEDSHDVQRNQLRGAGSVAAAVIALLLVGQPLVQHPPEPAADATIAAPVASSGTTSPTLESDAGTYEHSSPPKTTRDRVITLATDLTGPRPNGVMTLTSNIDEYLSPGQLSAVETHVKRIVNDEGAWEGSMLSVQVPAGEGYRSSTTTGVLHGEGAYEGLIAIMESDFDEMAWATSVEGIIEAELPPFPQAMPAK